MSEEPVKLYGADALIARYHEAAQHRNIARRTIALIILMIVVVYIFLFYTTVVSFRERQLPEFAATLNDELTAYFPQVGEMVTDSFDRVAPRYVEAFARVYERDQELYLQLLSDEFQDLELYAKSQRPFIEEAIAQLVVDQEMTANSALRDIFDEIDLVHMSNDYKVALEIKLEKLFENHLTAHLQEGERIITKLTKLAESDPSEGLTSDQITLGMVVELLGLEMQAEGDRLADNL